MKKEVAVIESRSKLKEFFKKLSWWKKIILLVLIIAIIIIVWWIFSKTSPVSEPYYIKDGLCYSDFLENCEGKKVEVKGRIIKGKFCPKLETETYILCETDTTICKTRHYRYDYDCSYGEYHLYKGRYNNCLSLVKPCFGGDTHKEINDAVESLLADPTGKKVKVTGQIFIERTDFGSSVSGKVNLVPESITVVGDES